MKKITNYEDAIQMTYRHVGDYITESAMQELYRTYRAYSNGYKDFAEFLVNTDTDYLKKA